MFEDLKVDAQIRFQKLPQEALSNKAFCVSDIIIYQFENVTNRALVLDNSQQEKFYISYMEDIGQIAVSRRLTEENIQSMFKVQEFSSVFSGKLGVDVFTYNVIPSLDDWMKAKYTKDFDYVIGKYYNLQKPEKRLEFYYYTLGATDASIDIEVFKNDCTVFYSTIYFPKASIII